MRKLAVFERLQLPSHDLYEHPSSQKTFPDGGQFRIEIPDVESPEQLKRVIETARLRGLTVHRVSQDSGITLLTDEEIKEMAAVGRSEGIEVSLFVGPRAGYDIGGQVKAPSGGILGKRVRGMDQLVYAVENVLRASDLGIRSFLIADEGLLMVLNDMRQNDELPRESIFKVSVSVGQSNPASAKLIEKIGGGTFNIPSDLTIAQISSIRSALDIPIDMYIVTPASFGGFVRIEEVGDIARVGAPVYLKFGITNPGNVFPAGEHVKPELLQMAEEEVRLAKLAVDKIGRSGYSLKASGKRGRSEPGIPV